MATSSLSTCHLVYELSPLKMIGQSLVRFGPYLLAGLTDGDSDIKLNSAFSSISDSITSIPSSYNFKSSTSFPSTIIPEIPHTPSQTRKIQSLYKMYPDLVQFPRFKPLQESS